MKQSSKASGKSQKIQYTGIFLDKSNKRKLLAAFPPQHEKVKAEHLTLHMNLNPKDIKDLPIGKKVDLQVLGEASGKQGQAVYVRTPLPSKNVHPHITISHPTGSSPKKSNEVLAKAAKEDKIKPLTLKGRVGYVQGNRKKFTLTKRFTKI